MYICNYSPPICCAIYTRQLALRSGPNSLLLIEALRFLSNAFRSQSDSRYGEITRSASRCDFRNAGV